MTLNKKWFDMILSGEKKEEYRDIKDYWATRFLWSREEIEWQCWQEMLDDMRDPYRRHHGPKDLMNFFGVQFKDYQAIHFVNGYGANRPAFDIEIENITVKRGRPDWGAAEGRYYFVFQLGRILEQDVRQSD